MRKKMILAVLILAALIVLNSAALGVAKKPPPPPPPEPEKLIPVLNYHDIVETIEASSDVTVTMFNSQMQFLADNGYVTMTMDDLMDFLNDPTGYQLPARPVVLTFDDNYIGTYTYMYPKMVELGFYATQFVHTTYVGVVTSKDHADWNELQEMESSGQISVESHTRNHLDLTTLSAQDRWDEIYYSKQSIEANLTSKTCDYIAYPYGAYNSNVIDDVTTAGYVGACKVGNTDVDKDTPDYEIPRTSITSTDTMETFKQKINYQLGIYVFDITLIPKTAGGGRKYAQAQVTIKDEDGNLVDGATVKGEWSGLVSGNSQGNTNGNGVATLDSPKTRSSGTVYFTVTDVTKSGCTYMEDLNVETSDQIDI